MEPQALFKGLLAVLILWAVISIILEEIFLALFDWKVYKNYLNGRGLKFPIKVGIILIFVNTYPSMDIFEKLLSVVDSKIATSAISHLATALLLSGGSSTVYSVANKLREARKNLAEKQ